MAIKTTHTFCRICEAACGLEVDVENNRILDHEIREQSRYV